METRKLVVTSKPWSCRLFICFFTLLSLYKGHIVEASGVVNNDVAVRPHISTQECFEKGFVRPKLQCANCDLVAEILPDEPDLHNECLNCCSDESNGDVVYPKAEFHYCNCNLWRFQGAREFINGDQEKYPNLELKHVQGALPQIFLKDESGEVAKTISVYTWDRDNINDFLQTKLAKKA